jgi:hypothetical protein
VLLRRRGSGLLRSVRRGVWRFGAVGSKLRALGLCAGQPPVDRARVCASAGARSIDGCGMLCVVVWVGLLHGLDFCERGSVCLWGDAHVARGTRWRGYWGRAAAAMMWGSRRGSDGTGVLLLRLLTPHVDWEGRDIAAAVVSSP